MVAIGGIQKFSAVDFPGHTAATIFTLGCNMRCGYCHNPELVLPERFVARIPEADILAFLKRRVGLLEAVVITGGEPTMHEDLPEFIRQLKQLGFLVKLDTNGTNPDMLEYLTSNSLLDFIAMDIKGPLHAYQQITARPINEQSILRSIQLILQVRHEFRTTIVRSLLCPSDFRQVGEMVRGAERYALQHFVPSKTLSPQLANAESFSDAEMQEAKTILEQYVSECVVH